MRRKIIQIRTIVTGDPDYERPLALCDDGSLWYFNEEDGWIKYMDIPDAQDREPTPDEL